MKKCTIIRIAACAAAVVLGAAGTAVAAEVAADEASEAVRGWAALQEALTGKERFSADGVAKVETYQGRDGRGSFHVVSFKGGGFAVTSGDTEIAPILAYSEDGEFVAGDEGTPKLHKAVYAVGCNMGVGHEPNGGVTTLEISKPELPSGKTLTVAVRPLTSLGTSGKPIVAKFHI